jgi:hypothetical protein
MSRHGTIRVLRAMAFYGAAVSSLIFALIVFRRGELLDAVHLGVFITAAFLTRPSYLRWGKTEQS